MIEKLTLEQEALIPVIRDKWIRKAITPTHRDVSIIQKNIAILYEIANITPVPVIVCEDLKHFENEISQLNKKESSVRSSVRSSVWSSVESSVRSSVWSSVRSSVRSSVESSVRSSVSSSVESSVESSVRSSVRSSVSSSVESSVRSSVGSSVRSSVWSSVESSVGLYYWADYLSYYDFWKETGIYTDTENIAKIEKYIDLLSDCSYGFITDKIAIVLTKPDVDVNDTWQLHSDQRMALRWKDGTGKYYLDGVEFQKELWQKVISKEMSLSEIMQIENADQRTVALKYNPQAIIKENAVLLHVDDRNNELYLVENSEINTLTEFPKMYFLKMLCPTGRVFIEGIDPEIAEQSLNATDCQAWLCGLTKSEYMDMKLEG